jgi:hypothetical protein
MYYYRINSLSINTISFILILIGTGSFLYVYLQGGFSKESLESTESNSQFLKQLEKLRVDLTQKLEESQTIKIDDSKVREAIDYKIDKITTESLFEQIKNKYEDRLVSDMKFNALDQELEYLKRRIERETARTSRNGNINLLIGFFTTFMAIFFLGYSLLENSNNHETTNSFIFHFIPRLSLSIFIELFSFFFLRIYKKNLDDIKYLNNERTNIDLKLIALRASIIYNDTDSTKVVIEDLSKTERNFVLKKGESTVEIEKNKTDNQTNDKLIESLVKLINKR